MRSTTYVVRCPQGGADRATVVSPRINGCLTAAHIGSARRIALAVVTDRVA